MKKLASFLWKVYHSLVFCRVGDFLVWNELNIFVFQGFPAVIVAISLGATQAVGYGSSEACWLDVKSGVAWAFIGPAILIISVSGYSLVLCFTSYQWNVRSTGCCDRKQINCFQCLFGSEIQNGEKSILNVWIACPEESFEGKGIFLVFVTQENYSPKMSILSHPCSFLTNTDWKW